jgi:SpoIIAA-like
MLTPIDNLPIGAIGFVASGRITSDDRRGVFEPTMSRALKTTERVKLLYVAGRDFNGYEHGSLYDEAVFGTRHFAHFEKIAFVSDEGPFYRAVQAMNGLVPATVRIFPQREIGAAKAWLAG